MAKRFTDTSKWRKHFFRGLQAPYKLVWLYLLDECDHAGIWDVEFDVMKLRVGIGTSEEEILKVFGEKIQSFDEGKKWFINDFIEFQYGELNPQNRAHNSVISKIKENKNKGLVRGLQGRKDKDKDKDKDKEGKKENDFLKMFNENADRNFKVISTKVQSQINARLKDGFTFDDFRKAIINCKNDDFHKENTKYLTPEFITRPDKLQTYLNIESQNCTKKDFEETKYKNWSTDE